MTTDPNRSRQCFVTAMSCSPRHTRAAALIKRITRSTWSHVSMYVGPLEEGRTRGCIVEADMAAASDRYGSRSCRARMSAFCGPIGLNDAVRDRLAEWVVSQIRRRI